MAQPEYAHVIRRLATTGDGAVVTIKQLRTELYDATPGPGYTNADVQIWTGRRWQALGAATDDPVTAIRSVNLIKDTGSKSIFIYTTSSGGSYLGTKENTQAAPAQDVKILDKSYKNAITILRTADMAILPADFFGSTDHSPLGYGRENITVGSGVLALGTAQTYAIDTTISSIGTAGGGDTDGVYWSGGVIVDCEPIV